MKVTWSPAASRGPISTMIGAPRRTQSQRLSAERIGFLSTKRADRLAEARLRADSSLARASQ